MKGRLIICKILKYLRFDRLLEITYMARSN